MNMGLNEYQASALSHLMFIGETKATTLSKASRLPSARIYGVLDELVKMGLVTIRPGRPTLYKARSPEEIASSLITLSMHELKQKLITLQEYAKDLTKIGKKIYLKGKKGIPTIPLLRIVSVGEVSLQETRKLYDTAKEEILILSKAMEYLPEVTQNLQKALTRGISIKIILMNPNLLKPENQQKQASIIEKLKETLTQAKLRFSEEVPIRGCIIDPKKEGKALFLVEDPGVPFFLREAAITSHPSVVHGLTLMFNLMWKHKSKPLSHPKRKNTPTITST
jgi:sugar-specific transcriptional regulator TrmB